MENPASKNPRSDLELARETLEKAIDKLDSLPNDDLKKLSHALEGTEASTEAVALRLDELIQERFKGFKDVNPDFPITDNLRISMYQDIESRLQAAREQAVDNEEFASELPVLDEMLRQIAIIIETRRRQAYFATNDDRYWPK